MAGWGLAIQPQHFLGLKDLQAVGLFMSTLTMQATHNQQKCLRIHSKSDKCIFAYTLH